MSADLLAVLKAVLSKFEKDATAASASAGGGATKMADTACQTPLEGLHIIRHEETLRALSVLLGHTFAPALSIVTHMTERITRFTAASTKRVCYRVGSHLCLPPIFCSCSAFKYQVAQKEECVLCKHLAAIEIASAEQRVRRELESRRAKGGDDDEQPPKVQLIIEQDLPEDNFAALLVD